jgi:hypothetical protein
MLVGMTKKTKDGEKPQSRASAARTLGHKRQDPPFRPFASSGQEGWGIRPGGGCHYRVAALATLRECRSPGATSGLTARFSRLWTVGLPILELPTRTVDLARL